MELNDEDTGREKHNTDLRSVASTQQSSDPVKSEQSVEISTEDEGIIVTGSLDALVLKEHLLVLVIESKKAAFSVEEGLAQLLSYMLANPSPKHPSFGMITTGGSFVFLKLIPGDSPRYATSNLFGTRNPGGLYMVFQILKRLGQLVSS